MAKVLVCEELPDTSSGSPQCSQWNFYDVVVMGATQPETIQPDQLALAFGTGFVLLIPLYAVIWKIRAARSSLNKS